MKTAIYVRVSTLEQAEEGYSIEEQIDKLSKYCEAKDWTITKIYKDPGFSGSNLNRPGLNELIKDIKKIDTVLVYKLDRLSRSQKDTLYLIEDVFAVNGAAFVSLSENFDTSTAFGKAMIGILAVFAQLEREQIKERMQMGKLGRAKSGKAMAWSKVPFGYEYIDGEYQVNELEASVVRDIFKRYLEGTSITKLKENLNAEGHIGKEVDWSYRTIRKILSNKTYAGYSKYKNEYFKAHFEPIISEEIYNQTAEQLAIRQKQAYAQNNNPRPFQAKYMVSGLVRCGLCGAGLGLHQYAKKNDGTRTKIYKCNTRLGINKNVTMKKADKCNSPDYPCVLLEKEVLDAIETLRLNPLFIDNIKIETNTFDVDLLNQRLDELDQKLEKLINLYLDSSFPVGILDNKKEVIQKEQKSIQKKITEAGKRKPELKKEEAIEILEGLDGSIHTLSYEDQKIIVRRLIKQVTVYPDKLLIQWRFAV